MSSGVAHRTAPNPTQQRQAKVGWYPHGDLRCRMLTQKSNTPKEPRAHTHAHAQQQVRSRSSSCVLIDFDLTPRRPVSIVGSAQLSTNHAVVGSHRGAAARDAAARSQRQTPQQRNRHCRRQETRQGTNSRRKDQVRHRIVDQHRIVY
jgi:hypothetical protein